MSKKIDPNKIETPIVRSTKPKEKEEVAPPPITQGAVDRAIDLAFNSSREKIREMTSIDKMQARLLPPMDVASTGVHYVLAVATYREEYHRYELMSSRITESIIKNDLKKIHEETSEEFNNRVLHEVWKRRKAVWDSFELEKPTPPDLLEEYIYRTAQWNKSINGKNLESIIDIALAEQESAVDSSGGYDDKWGVQD